MLPSDLIRIALLLSVVAVLGLALFLLAEFLGGPASARRKRHVSCVGASLLILMINSVLTSMGNWGLPLQRTSYALIIVIPLAAHGLYAFLSDQRDRRISNEK